MDDNHWSCSSEAGLNNSILLIGFFIISVFILLVTIQLRAIRWKVILGEKIETNNLYIAQLIGYMGNNLLPLRFGEFFKSYYLEKKINISRYKIFGSVILERVLDLFAGSGALGLEAISRGAYFGYFYENNIDVDVCVIGGGLTGVTSAFHLATRGYKVVLLEARNIGWGASGRNGGQLSLGLRKNQQVLEKKLDHFLSDVRNS